MKRLLGVSHGTAAHHLGRAIMFRLVQQTKQDVCYRCKKTIKRIEEFSIEHKEPWQHADNPKDTFFDLDNIAFSHKVCNSRHGSSVIRNRKPNPNYHLGRQTVAKLTKEQASEIKQLLREGTMSNRKIGAMYGVHFSSIWAISSGKSWKDA